jgi:glycosyltransferase involved in cell wall biosynthesis
MQRPLNVLMVTEFPLDDPAGGITTMLRALADELGPRCRVIWLKSDWDARTLVGEKVDGEQRYTMRLASPYDARRPLYGFGAWATAFASGLSALQRVLTSESIDIAHLHYAAPFHYYFRLTRKLLGIPYIVTLHRGDIVGYPKLPRANRALVRFALNGADGVVSVSRWLAAQAHASLGTLPSLTVIENGIDLRALDAPDDFAGSSDNRPGLPSRFFLMVSNVAHYKAQDVAIRAWAIVKSLHPDLPLLIVGAPRDLWDECVRLIEELGCGDVIKLLGPLPRNDALALMRRATALVIPSRSEGLPYVLLEAGALGTPIICSDIGPFTEVVEHEKTALVTPVEDHRAVAQAALRLLANPEFGREMGSSLSRRVRSDFTAAAMAARYWRLYQRVLPDR